MTAIALTAVPAAAQTKSGIAVVDLEEAVARSAAFTTAMTQMQTTYKPQLDQINTRRAAIEADLKAKNDALQAAYKAAGNKPLAARAVKMAAKLLSERAWAPRGIRVSAIQASISSVRWQKSLTNNTSSRVSGESSAKLNSSSNSWCDLASSFQWRRYGKRCFTELSGNASGKHGTIRRQNAALSPRLD